MANSAKTDSAPSRNKKKGTVFPVDLQIDRYRTLEGFDFVDALFADLERLKDQRFEYYCDRFKKSPANRLRSNLVLFAILATVLTAVDGNEINAPARLTFVAGYKITG